MDIDFVIPWVDGSDPEWRKSKNKYSGKIDEPVDRTDARYRDWDILKYWFRGVEKYAPWVHKIYFVTCGQKPDWLNENHEKLILVNHEDYISLNETSSMQIFMIVTSQKGVIDMRAGFIGAGKVGFSLGKYLKENGVEITGYFSKSPESAKSAADFTNTKLYKSIENILSDSDTLFITVPDGQISKVWDYMKNLDIKNKNICHCSGSISSTVFFDGENLGANIYSVHPLYAISDKCESWKHLNKAYFTVEGSAENLDEIKSIFERAGNKVIAMGAENKSLYHCGAVVVSNLVNGLFQVGAEMLVKCGFDKKDAKKALVPLFTGNADTLAEKGVAAALTGPVERNDLSTITKHIEAIKAAWINESEEKVGYEMIYLLLSEKLLSIAQEKHLDSDYLKMTEVIKNEKHSIHF